MKILVWGLGPCGLVNAACLAQSGHEVIGIEADAGIAQAIEAGVWPIKEPGLPDLLAEAKALGRFAVRTVSDDVIAGAELSLVCVGTPPTPEAGLDTTQVERVIETIASLIGAFGVFHAVAVRSTMPIGSLRQGSLPALERRHRLGSDFGLATFPEFLREGSAITDFRSPALAVIGALDERTRDRLVGLHEGIDVVPHCVEPEQAETLKLVNNAFRALKVGFANEVGRLCQSFALDGGVLMDLVCADTRLNISPAYLRPGLAFGGSCLHKDLAALVASGESHAVLMPILGAVAESNRCQTDLALDAIRRQNGRRVGFLGLAFKAGTDDLRNSPAFTMAATLVAEGYRVVAHDPDLALPDVSPHNLKLIRQHLGIPSRVLLSPGPFVDRANEIVVVAQRRPAFQDIVGACTTAGATVLDLTDPSLGWMRQGP